MTGPRKHPCYPGTARPVLIGDTAHDRWDGRRGVVVFVSNFGSVGLALDDERVVTIPVEWLRIGPAPEPEPPLLAIRPTRADLRELVRHALAWGDDSNTGPVTRLVLAAVATLPADELAAFRAEIEAGL